MTYLQRILRNNFQCDKKFLFFFKKFSEIKVHGAIMGPTWVLSAPDGPHVGPMNLAVTVTSHNVVCHESQWLVGSQYVFEHNARENTPPFTRLHNVSIKDKASSVLKAFLVTLSDHTGLDFDSLISRNRLGNSHFFCESWFTIIIVKMHILDIFYNMPEIVCMVKYM